MKTKKRRRMTMLAHAQQKAGKTRFGLTLPGKVKVFNFDQGLEGLLDELLEEGRDIEVMGANEDGPYPSYALPILDDEADPEEVKAIAMPILKQFTSDFRDALSPDDDCDGLLVDVSGQVYDLARYAYIGHNQKGEGFEYNKLVKTIKLKMRNLALAAMNGSKNVVFLDRSKMVWDGPKPKDPELWKPEGWDGLPYEVHVVLYLSKEVWKKEATFKAEIQDSRIDQANVVGLEFEGDEVDFCHIASFITGTEKEEWER